MRRPGHPNVGQSNTFLDRFAVEQTQPVHGAATLAQVEAWRQAARAVHVDAKIKRYIVDIVALTREKHPYVEYGASPRATLALAYTARAKALLSDRDFVLPDDVRAIAPLVLRHRVAFTYKLAVDRADPEEVVGALIASVKAP